MLTFPTQQSQMFNLAPAFRVDSSLNDFFFIIDTDSHNPDFSLPIFFIFLKHLLVVLHWFLAGSAPGGPNIDKQNFPRLMCEFRLFLRKDFMEVLVDRHLLSSANLLPTFKLKSQLFEAFSNSFDFLFWQWRRALDVEVWSCLDFKFGVDFFVTFEHVVLGDWNLVENLVFC